MTCLPFGVSLCLAAAISSIVLEAYKAAYRNLSNAIRIIVFHYTYHVQNIFFCGRVNKVDLGSVRITIGGASSRWDENRRTKVISEDVDTTQRLVWHVTPDNFCIPHGLI